MQRFRGQPSRQAASSDWSFGQQTPLGKAQWANTKL
jgi:hypothetical protein